MQDIEYYARKLGIIGGLGPLATALFYELVTRMTRAERDQDHLEILIISKPGIPDRTEYIISEKSKNPIPEIISSGRKLAGQGAEILAMPCVTAHCFYDQIIHDLPVPLINMITETVSLLREQQIKRVGLMATDGTIACQLFQRALDHSGISTVIPDSIAQQGLMHVIYKNIKADKKVDIDLFNNARNDLREKGAEIIVLGCTELSLLKRDYDIGKGYLDSLEVLARCTVEKCLAQLSPRASELFN